MRLNSLRLFEIASVLVRLDHVVHFIEHANHSIMRAADKSWNSARDPAQAGAKKKQLTGSSPRNRFDSL